MKIFYSVMERVQELPMKNLLLVRFLLISVLFLVTTDGYAGKSGKAKQLLTYDKPSNSYSLQVDGLAELYDQNEPVIVISAVGDSRLGKSTNLNFIRHFWDGDQQKLFEKAFDTSDSTEPCTRGVWVSAVPKALFMDVQGTDLEDDRVTEKLSMFTALMSSAMVLFVRGNLVNHQLNFLYRIARLSELIFGAETASSHFPLLSVIVREPLRPKNGKTLAQTIADAIVSPNHRDGMDEERKFLASYLKGREIKVFDVPHTKNDTLQNFYLLIRSEYKKSIETITEKFKSFPFKKRANGGKADGKYLVELAKTLLGMMNGNSWLDLPSAYDMLERDFCQQSFNTNVKPLLNSSLSALKDGYKTAMEQMKKSCFLQTEIVQSQSVLNQTIEAAEKQIALQEAIYLEKQKRQIADDEHEKTKVMHAREIAIKSDQIENEKDKRGKLETAVQEYQKMQKATTKEMESLKREINRLEIEKQRLRKSNNANGVCFSLNLPWFRISARKEF